VTDLTIRVSGGFGTEYPDMSPSLRAKVAQSDAEYDRQAARDERQRRIAAESAHERTVDAAAWALAREAGIPLTQARRECGHQKHEFIALISARQDLEDAQRLARQRQALRHAGIDPFSGEPIEVPAPSDLEVEAAAVLAPRSESPESVGRGVRSRWLRKRYQVME
jgi:hypothetical protein